MLVTSDRAQAAAITEIFDRYIIMDDVEVADISDKLSAVGLAGPQRCASPASAPASMSRSSRPGQVIDLVWQNIGISVARGTHPNMDAYEIWFAAEHAAAVWDALIAAGATPVGSEALELYRIARGVPRYGVDLSQRDLPQETEQKHALNFTKGCYIGQEIVERIRARAILHRTFTGFLRGRRAAASRHEDQSTATRTSAKSPAQREFHFPSGERTLALGYLRREFEAPGTSRADRRTEGHSAIHSVPVLSKGHMAAKDREEQSEFVVNDRRLFSSDGELRQDVVEAEERAAERERDATEAQQRANEERAAASRRPRRPAEADADVDHADAEAAGGAHRRRAAGQCRCLRRLDQASGRAHPQRAGKAGKGRPGARLRDELREVRRLALHDHADAARPGGSAGREAACST